MPAPPEARATLERREPNAYRGAATLHPFAAAATSVSFRSPRPSLSSSARRQLCVHTALSRSAGVFQGAQATAQAIPDGYRNTAAI